MRLIRSIMCCAMNPRAEDARCTEGLLPAGSKDDRLSRDTECEEGVTYRHAPSTTELPVH